DHRGPQADQRGGRPLQERGLPLEVLWQARALGRELLDVAAGAEVGALSAEQQAADPVRRLRELGRLDQRLEQGLREPVRGLGAVQTQAGDAVVEREENWAFADQLGHARSFSRSANSLIAPSAASPAMWSTTASSSIRMPSASGSSSPSRIRDLVRASAAR